MGSPEFVEKFGIGQYFEVVTGAELDGRRNAKAEVIEECLKRLGNPDKDNVLMIGDREHDIIGAKNCGIRSIGVKYLIPKPWEDDVLLATLELLKKQRESQK